MSFSPSDENRAIDSVNNIRAFTRLLPNLEVIELSYMRLVPPTFHTIFQSCDMVRVLKLNGLRRGLIFWWLWWKFTMGRKCDWDLPWWNPASYARCNTLHKMLHGVRWSGSSESELLALSLPPPWMSEHHECYLVFSWLGNFESGDSGNATQNGSTPSLRLYAGFEVIWRKRTLPCYRKRNRKSRL
jgi:hypothetical protein